MSDDATRGHVADDATGGHATDDATGSHATDDATGSHMSDDATGGHAATPPAGRYGPEPTARTRLARRLGLAALLLAAVAVLAWVGLGTLRDPVQWRDVGYHVDGATSIDVTFDVTKDTGATATCRVEALSSSYAQVGVSDVEVGPGPTRTQRVTVTIPTAETAVTGTVRSCRVGG